MTSPRFLTLFPRLRHVAIKKDPGLIPYYFAKSLGWQSDLVFCQVEPGKVQGSPEYERHVTLKSLAYTDDRLERFRLMATYLAKHARSYGAVMLYQLGIEAHALAALYKMLHPKGVVFLKLDMDEPTANMLLGSTNLKRQLHSTLLKHSAIDFFTVETQKIHDRIAPYFAAHDKPLHLVPNGIELNPNFDIKEVQGHKKPHVLTVGRLGMPQKRSEMLLDAVMLLTKEEIGPWKFIFIGTGQPCFEEHLQACLHARPELEDHLVRIHHIDDKETLNAYYKDARYFCLTSGWESFGLVLVEAIYHGCALITTDVGAAQDIINHTQFGHLLKEDTPEGLAKMLRPLLRATPMEQPEAEVLQEVFETTSKRFGWEGICAQMEGLIQDVSASSSRP